ncbi:reverse transcriptase N-terminal domain-containing protein [Priestia megaterium]|uniref:reverse transcriptase N-terminal domain-containing protein n=1 Tax=Priestia megaterium TaxID=1404 RepID=UPI00211CAE7F|nr:reverse transcriptase N-terminal domain-containing protein [Priestia megaterium]
MNSKAALLLSIRRVTQLNRGKRTSGVDKYKALLPSERMSLYMEMKEQNIKLHNPKPAYRTYIQKKNGKRRPLDIPTIRDRVRQNIVKLALEPQWEAKYLLNHLLPKVQLFLLITDYLMQISAF